MLCLITNDESLQKQFILVSSILKTSLIEAQSLPEILQHFSTKLCQGVIFDKRHPDLNEVDRTLWIKEHLPQETFIVFIDPPLQNEEIQKIFLDFQAMQPPEYPIPEFLLQEYIQEIPEKIKNLKKIK